MPKPTTPSKLLPHPPLNYHFEDYTVHMEKIDGQLFVHVDGVQVFPKAPIIEAKDTGTTINLQPGMTFSPDAPTTPPPTPPDTSTIIGPLPQ